MWWEGVCVHACMRGRMRRVDVRCGMCDAWEVCMDAKVWWMVSRWFGPKARKNPTYLDKSCSPQDACTACTKYALLVR